MQALTGSFEHSLDDKNRLFAPALYREQLSEEQGRHFMLSKGQDKCLYLFLPSQWEQHTAKLEAAKFKTPQARRAYMRDVFGKAVRATLDDQGRILVPEALREHAGLQKDVTIVGSGPRAEVWNSKTLAAAQKAEQKEIDAIGAELDI